MLKTQREHYNMYTLHKYIWISLAWLHTVQHLGRFFSFLICTHKNIHHHPIFLFHWGVGIRIFCSIRHITGLIKIALDNINKKNVGASSRNDSGYDAAQTRKNQNNTTTHKYKQTSYFSQNSHFYIVFHGTPEINEILNVWKVFESQIISQN